MGSLPSVFSLFSMICHTFVIQNLFSQHENACDIVKVHVFSSTKQVNLLFFSHIILVKNELLEWYKRKKFVLICLSSEKP